MESNPSPLEKLPPEIFLEIIKDIDIISLASLGLTNQNLFRRIGQDRVWILKKPYSELTYDLLELLARDVFVGRIFCRPCQGFHSIKNAERFTIPPPQGRRKCKFERKDIRSRICVWVGSWPNETISGMAMDHHYKHFTSPKRTPLTPKCQVGIVDKQSKIYFSAGFNSTIAQMAIKHFKYSGNDKITLKLLDTLSDTPQARTSNQDTPFIDPSDYFDSIEACREFWDILSKHPPPALPGSPSKTRFRIKDGTLYMSKCVTFSGEQSSLLQASQNFRICPHLLMVSDFTHDGNSIDIGIRDVQDLTRVRHSFFFFLSKLNYGISASKGIECCQRCRTEYKLDMESGKDGMLSLHCRIWKCLGKGPGTEDWQAHLAFIEFPLNAVFKVPLNPGDISAVFEEKLKKEREICRVIKNIQKKISSHVGQARQSLRSLACGA